MGFLLLPLYHSWEKAKDLWEASPIGVLNKVFTWSSPLVSPVNVGPVSCKAMEDLVPVAEKDFFLPYRKVQTLVSAL